MPVPDAKDLERNMPTRLVKNQGGLVLLGIEKISKVLTIFPARSAMELASGQLSFSLRSDVEPLSQVWCLVCELPMHLHFHCLVIDRRVWPVEQKIDVFKCLGCGNLKEVVAKE